MTTHNHTTKGFELYARKEVEVKVEEEGEGRKVREEEKKIKHTCVRPLVT